jgi:LysM repeat protein
VQKAAKRASVAVPVLAVSGALAAAPQALAATSPGVQATSFASVTHPVSAQLDAAVHPAAASFTTYMVKPGDTLSGIALRLFGRASDWHQLYWQNRSKISNPNVISVGTVLVIPRHLSTRGQHSTGGHDSTGSQHTVGDHGSAGSQHSAGGQASTGSKPSTRGQHSAHRAAARSQSSGDSPTSLRVAVQKDVASGNYLLAVGQYLVENGYSAAAAAGVASCVYGESTGNPESVGTGGGGLIGWTPIGSAAPDSNIITGNPEQDMMAQLSDLLYYNSSEIGQPLVNQLNTISDPVAAADFFSQNFEKPAVTDSDVVPSVAEQIFSALGG